MKTKIFMLVLSFSLLGSGCQSLKEDAYDFISPDSFYKTEADALASITGVYAVLNSSNLFNVGYFNLLNMSGCIGIHQDQRMLELLTGQHNPNSNFISESWNGLYEGVRKANTTLEGVPRCQMDETKKKSIIAEAKFMRALFYFWLVRTYGPVPLRTSALVEDAKLHPSPIKDVYQVIIDDLESAIPDLANKGVYERGRATKDAGQALLANVYLTLASAARAATEDGSQGAKRYDVFAADIATNYQKCKTLCGEIITRNSFKLLTNWMDLWGIPNRMNDEFIFMILTITDTDLGTVLPNRYTPANSPFSPHPGFYGGLTYEFVKSYNPQDIRFTDGMIWQFNSVVNNALTKWRRNINSATQLVTGTTFPLLDNKKYQDPNATNRNQGGCSVPIIRMAEVYLMYSEAENEIAGPTTDAFAKINAIRSRVNCPLLTIANTPTKADLRKKIIDERMWEFALESKDFFDCARTGQLEARTYGLSYNPLQNDTAQHLRARNAKDYLFPYPQTELLTNPNISLDDQN
ncbi:MAG: RagB/SusD family nutrient uptake outer membrane protein [Bacteroidota bacterium]